MRWSLPPMSLLVGLLASACDPPAGWIPDSEPEPVADPSRPGDMEVSIAPAEPTSVDNLMVQVVREAVDPDGDMEGVHYSWWVDGLHLQALDDAAAVLAEQTSRGEVWEVRAQAYDSTGLLGPETSAQVAIGNSAPSAPGIVLEPEEPAAGADPLRCVVAEAAEDPDGDPLSYTFRWT
ncbi:MAG: hypothetical protein VX498_07805, partial [Myxococcota bacterium]|nr:hypothetical protein [Myxococcota bacterium]